MRIVPSTAIVVVLAFASQLSAADKRPMTLEDFFAIKRVAAPQISPDGKHVVYQITEVNLEKNKTNSALWVTTTDGKGTPKQITKTDGGFRAANPRWSPDGKHILFEGGPPASDAPWLYVTDTAGKEPVPVARSSGGATNAIWSPDGKYIAFVSSVSPEFSEKPFAESDKLNKEKNDEIAKSPVKARTFTKLFYRHWIEYVGDKRQHIFVVEANLNPDTGFHTPRDVTPGDRDAFPTSSTFSSGDNFTFTPDSKAHRLYRATRRERSLEYELRHLPREYHEHFAEVGNAHIRQQGRRQWPEVQPER